jgi:5-methylcytosine-specific restriction endonuclease McrA
MTPYKNCPHCGNQLTIERTQYFVTEACESCLQHWQVTHYDTCCIAPDLETVLLPTAGSPHVRKQCRTCGNITPQPLGGFTKEQREALPVANTERRDSFREKLYEMQTAFYARKQLMYQRQKEADSQAWWENYNAYLLTPKWQRKRTLVLRRDNYLCQACLTRPANEVHHRSYEFVGQEPCFDLVSVCSECHKKIHDLRNQKKLS